MMMKLNQFRVFLTKLKSMLIFLKNNQLKCFLVLLFFCVLLMNCGSNANRTKMKITSEITMEVLTKKGIVARFPKYKKLYPTLLPYLFYNNNNTFIELQGDFFNLKKTVFFRERPEINRIFLCFSSVFNSSS